MPSRARPLRRSGRGRTGRARRTGAGSGPEHRRAGSRPSLHRSRPRELVRLHVLELDLAVETGAQPACDQERIRARPRHLRSSFTSAIVGQSSASNAAPAKGTAVARCPRSPPGRSTRPALRSPPECPPTPLESTIIRSTTRPSDRTPAVRRRAAAPAREDGKIGDQQRLDDAGRRVGTRAAQMQLDHLGADPCRASLSKLKRYTETLASIASRSASGSGTERIVRDGCASARPASVPRAASSQFFGTHAVWVITLVRRSGGRSPPVRISPEPLLHLGSETSSPCHSSTCVGVGGHAQ